MIVGLLLAAGGFGAGVFGSLLGLGGGILIVPLLTVGFGVPFREAVGVSLVCVIVTSSAAAGVYLERHVANLRLGMLLEVFTAAGALAGGLVAFAPAGAGPGRSLRGAARVYTAFSMLRRSRVAERGARPSPRRPTAGAAPRRRAGSRLGDAGEPRGRHRGARATAPDASPWAPAGAWAPG